MRNNQPVNDHEVLLSKEHLIVSKTDLKGIITFVNRDFVQISGYSEAELLGQPHNLIRHPDMPSETFADLWRDLQARRPWVGLVKNRCKDGGFYWVRTAVTPLYEDGKMSGYMSVRRQAERAEIVAAEAAYHKIREGQAGGLHIRHGSVCEGGAGWFSGWSLRQKIRSGFAVLLLGMVLVAALGLWGILQVHGSAIAINENSVKPAQSLALISRLMEENRSQILLSLQHDPAGAYHAEHDHGLDHHLRRIEGNVAEISRQWEQFSGRIDTDAERELADRYVEARMNYLNNGLLPAKKALADGQFDLANQILLQQINPAHQATASRIDALLRAQVETAQTLVDQGESVYRDNFLWGLALLALGLALGAWIAAAIMAALGRSISEIQAVFRALARGDSSYIPDVSRDDEMGKVLQGLQSMQMHMSFNLAQIQAVANDNMRVRMAFDCVNANLRIADMDGTVLYANQGLLEMLRRIEPTLREQQPGFTIDGFVGSNIGVFYADPQAALRSLRELQGMRTVEMEIGGRIFNVVTNPIINARGERLGSVGEWVDRTAEILAQREMAKLIQRAAAGDFDARLETSVMEGFYAELGDGINTLFETTAAAVGKIAELLSQIASGDLLHTVDGDFQGLFGRLQNDANQTVARLRELVGEIQGAAEMITVASKEIALGNQDLSARTEEQASSLEETASSMEELAATVKQNAENARQASVLGGTAQTVVETGGAVVGKVVETMASIQQASTRIADIIGVIDGIAFQTNILALNAAVEAARAGEQGRGFAVVASEVRNLAQRSAAAAKEIKALISDSVERVDAGSRLVDQAGSAMGEIMDSIGRVAHIVNDIARASREQSMGIEQVSAAVVQMDRATQQNAALVEQAAAAAESLEEQAVSMHNAAAVFRLPQRAPAARASSKRQPRLAKGQKQPALAQKKLALPARLDDEWEEF
ncbi:methyl-accepting chemotaxis protein [Azonexus sp.]|uniref:methyl-accepting chemotaxis protein n=1 Tax=Azonexus sp. TaxID=1872668 RepID=UPI0039E3C137